MASITGLIEQVQIDSNAKQNIASTAYGECTTGASNAAKTVEMTGFFLLPGVTVHIKFINENTANNPTLNINSTGAKPLVQYGTTAVGKTSETNGWQAGAVLSLTYDGTSWVRDQGYNTNSQANYGNITTAGKIGSGNNLVVTSSGTVKAGATISSAVNSQTTSTKFLREDGTWATPSYIANRTYTAISGKKPTGNQTPEFGGTFDIEQVGQDTTGQVSVTERTVKIPDTAASTSTAGLVNTDAQTFAGVKTFNNGIEIKGHIAGDTGTSGHGLWGGGGYHNAYNNIILHGDATTGTSGIAFISDKGTTTINQPSDRAFIQWHAHGVTTYSAEGTNPTLATSGESNTLVIGVGNDTTDTIRLQAPGTAGILHQIGTTAYPIPHTTNTNGSVGGAGTPVYVEAGVIKAGTALGGAAYKAENYYALSNHNHDSTYSYIHLSDYDFTDTQPLSKYVTFDKSKPTGAPKEEWYNGFISSHSNYHASYIINGHTNQNEWYVGHGIWREANTPHAMAPTWYLLAHSGNVGTGDNNGQVKIAGQNISVKGLKALAYKDSLIASDVPDIGNTYLKLSGGTMTGDIKGNALIALGTTANPFHNIVLGGATSDTLTADSTNPRITFQESNNGTQPVHLIYSDYDSYRSPAGLKIIGGTSASPAWLEVEGNVYAAAFKGHADSATSANYINLYEARGTTTTLNKVANYIGAGKMFHLVASSNTSTTDNGKTPTDANILQMNWDNSGGYDAQLGIATGANRMYFRSRPSQKIAWDEVAHAPVGAGVGSATQPVYMTFDGVITAGTALKALAYKDSLTSSDIPDNAANTTGNAATSTSSKYLYPFNDGTNTSGTTDIQILTTLQADDNIPRSKPFGVLLQHGNHSVGFGYFYPKSSQYGGWYIANYNGPSYIGLNNGTWKSYTFLTNQNYTSYAVAKTAGVTAVTWDSTNKKITKTINGTTSDVVTAETLKAAINVTAADLGLSKAMRFIGIATVDITDGSTTDPRISGYSTKTAGDVIIDKDSSREYIWSTTNKWELLGGDSSYKVTQTAVTTATAETTEDTVFVSSVTQNENGEITVKTRPLDTNGTWEGNAVTATTASNLSAKPSFAASGNKITLAAGGKTSDAFTVPYATSAGSATTATYIKCTDTRNTALNPTDLTAAQGIRFDFKAKGTINLTATDPYAGVMSFRPYASNSNWSGGHAHQIAFNSKGLYRRIGSTSWGNWYQILDSNNTAAGSNNAATLAWNMTYTIAKINDTDIKFTTMAKPTYTFTDLTAHPTTLAGYGITDAAAGSHSHTLTIGNQSLSVSTTEQTWALHDILYNPTAIRTATSWDQYTPGVYYVASSSAFTGTNNPENTNTNGGIAPYRYGQLIVSRAGNGGIAQFYISHQDSNNVNYGIHYRTGWNNAYLAKWSVLLDSGNYTNYTVTKTGTGASGTWGISVTGTAANVTGTVAIEHGGTGATTASAAANALISGLPTWTATPTADTYFIRRDTTGAAAFGQVKFSSIANITNNTLTLGPYSSTLVTSVNGNIGAVTITAADLGLSNAMHFIGVVASSSTNTPSDGSNSVPTITGLSSYTPAAGDVIIDKDNLREYVWSNGAWILLGFTTSNIYNSDSITASSSNEPTWISNIQQATDGKISVQRQTIGTLGIGHGGTGKSEWTQWGIVYASATNTLDQVTAGASNNINQPLISGGVAAPKWYAGLTLAGNAAASYIATFKGITASTSVTTGAVTIAGGLGVAGRITASEINATRQMVVSAGKVYSNISGSNVLIPAKTSMLFSDGVAFASPGLAAASDVGWIRMLGTDENTSILEIATGDDGGTGEKIVVRQYNTSNTVIKEAILLEKTTGATSFPVSVTAPKFIGALEGNADTATTANKVSNNLVIKLNNGTTENTNMYTYNGSAGKTLNIIPGSNITFTTAAGSLTIAGTANNAVTQNIIAANTNKKYGILFSAYETSATTTTASSVYRDSKIYINPSLYQIVAGQLTLHDKGSTAAEKVSLQWNTTDQALEFIFV